MQGDVSGFSPKVPPCWPMRRMSGAADPADCRDRQIAGLPAPVSIRRIGAPGWANRKVQPFGSTPLHQSGCGNRRRIVSIVSRRDR
jgi:hypothetical protein